MIGQMKLLEDVLTIWGDVVGSVLTDWLFTAFGLGWVFLIGAVVSGVLAGPVLLTTFWELSSAGSWISALLRSKTQALLNTVQV